MGWLDDFVQNPVATVSNTVNREVSNFSNNVNAYAADAANGDAGKFVVDKVTAGLNIVKSPFQAVYHIGRGENDLASKTIQKAIGSRINLEGTQQSGTIFNPQTIGISLAQSESGQSTLRSQPVKEATLGLSEDWAGVYRGSRTLQDSSTLSREDQNSAFRLGVKGAVVYAGAAYGPGLYADAKAGWAGLSTGGKGAAVASGGGLIDRILKGDTKGAAKAITDYFGAPDVSQYIPDNPKDVPVYTGSPRSSAPVGSTSPQVNDPWGTSDYLGGGFGSVAQGSTIPLLIGAGFLGYLVYRKIK